MLFLCASTERTLRVEGVLCPKHQLLSIDVCQLRARYRGVVISSLPIYSSSICSKQTTFLVLSELSSESEELPLTNQNICAKIILRLPGLSPLNPGPLLKRIFVSICFFEDQMPLLSRPCHPQSFPHCGILTQSHFFIPFQPANIPTC